MGYSKQTGRERMEGREVKTEGANSNNQDWCTVTQTEYRYQFSLTQARKKCTHDINEI